MIRRIAPLSPSPVAVRVAMLSFRISSSLARNMIGNLPFQLSHRAIPDLRVVASNMAFRFRGLSVRNLPLCPDTALAVRLLEVSPLRATGCRQPLRVTFPLRTELLAASNALRTLPEGNIPGARGVSSHLARSSTG